MRPTLLRSIVLTVLVAITLGSAGGALAQALKIGIVDVEYVIHTSKKGKAAKAKLKKLFETKQKELDSAQEQVLAKKKEIEGMSAMATPEKKRALAMEYQQALLKLQELYVKNQQDLQKREIDLMKPILKSLEEVLTTMAESQKFDIIMNRSEHGVLFAREAFDITKSVLDKMDAAKGE
jgi:outer membrane protein